MITSYQKWQHPTDFKMQKHSESIFPEKMSSILFSLMTTKEQRENCTSSLQHKQIALRKYLYSCFSPTKIKGKKVSCVMEVEDPTKKQNTHFTIVSNDV